MSCAEADGAAVIPADNEFTTVDHKKHRGGLGDVFSFFRQREVRLEYRVAPLDAGLIGIKRLFLVDGQAVEDFRKAPPDTKKIIQRYVDESPKGSRCTSPLFTNGHEDIP